MEATLIRFGLDGPNRAQYTRFGSDERSVQAAPVASLSRKLWTESIPS